MNFRMPEWPASGISARISGIKTNQISEIADLARDDPAVIKLWLGEGDLPTPDFICNASVKALSAGHTRYTYSLGIPELRLALDRYHQRHWNVDVGADRFSVTAGGTEAVMQAFQAILNPGDEVIVPAPAWPNVEQIVRILGGTVVPVPYRLAPDGSFYLDLDDIRAAVTDKTRVISINSPSNPTGWIMPREEMIALRDLCRSHDLWILSDEVYAHFTYNTGIAPSFLEVTEPTDRLIVINTFSKNWCMTGWRIGWMVYPRGMDSIFENMSQYNTTGVATFIQHAAVAALDEGDEFIKKFARRSGEARRLVCSALTQLPNVQVVWPEGAFYALFSVRGMHSGYEMARRILREARIGVAPGSAFGLGGDAYLRICFAVDPVLMEEAAGRLVAFLNNAV